MIVTGTEKPRIARSLLAVRRVWLVEFLVRIDKGEVDGRITGVANE